MGEVQDEVQKVEVEQVGVVVEAVGDHQTLWIAMPRATPTKGTKKGPTQPTTSHQTEFFCAVVSMPQIKSHGDARVNPPARLAS